MNTGYLYNSVIVVSRCHNLTYCSICYCEHVTDAGLELLATLPSLVSLDISGCNVQDHGVSSLGNSSRLRDITLSECRAITDLGLQVKHHTNSTPPPPTPLDISQYKPANKVQQVYSKAFYKFCSYFMFQVFGLSLEHAVNNLE